MITTKQAWKEAYRAQRMVNELNYDLDGDPVYMHDFTISKRFQHALDYALRPCEDELNRKSPGSVLLTQRHNRSPWGRRVDLPMCRCSINPVFL